MLYVLLAFLSLGAIGGGLSLLADPSGELMGMPASGMVRSPFGSFLIPGLLLLVVFGLFPLAVMYGLHKQPPWKRAYALTPFKELHASWSFSLYIGFGQVIWIMVQTYLWNMVNITHVIYMSLGLLIQILTLLPGVQRYFVLDGRGERR
ncbi:hypothetical protein MHI24_18630 [Paenibacillus sp. FSL K6-1096]|uniref:hypothetical protein n=1 Tax=Paenibacillus sp. FSL K6-1096 TaxID=2921460 RepID=UPI0030ED741D